MIGIFGVTGFIGQSLLKRLVDRRLPVKGASRRIPQSLIEKYEGRAKLEEFDIGQALTVGSSLEGVDVVVQLVSTSSPGLKNAYEASDIRENVIPHVEFIKSALDYGVKRYVFLSSGGTVYGPGSVVPTPEDAPTTPISSHGLTKLTIEKYLQMHGHVDDLDFVILRLANPFGPGQSFRKGQGLVPAVLEKYLSGEAVKIFGDGEARRDYIYIDDVLDAIEAAVTRPQAAKNIINIGSGESRSVNEVLAAMESVMDVEFKREVIPARQTDVDISMLDISRAKQLLDWEPKTDFVDGLRKTLRDGK